MEPNTQFKMGIILKEHSQEGKILFALCDEDLIGKVFREDKMILNLESNFYNGTLTEESVIEENLKSAYIVNAVGEKSIQLLLDNGLADKDSVMYIDGIPHIQALITNDV